MKFELPDDEIANYVSIGVDIKDIPKVAWGTMSKNEDEPSNSRVDGLTSFCLAAAA